MQLDGVVLLAAHTARSQAYVQALVANDLYPGQVILFGKERPVEVERNTRLVSWQGVDLPDLGKSLLQSCKRAGIPVTSCPADDVNAEEIAHCISNFAPRLVIYSGVGGQLVSEHLLGMGPRFLHMHSGWLPRYRGSTTLYYALLEGELPGVTALFLDRAIDTGPVLMKRHYSTPPLDIDLDQIYDPAIRADLLVRIMREYARSGVLPPVEHQDPDEGVTYYVIHPVLKHLAILSLSKSEMRDP
jgi:methionyl-tRNA formyltransferase